jgi:S-adenosylmethionine decarboxylase
MSFAFRYFHPNPGWTAGPSVGTSPAGPDSPQQSVQQSVQNTAAKTLPKSARHIPQSSVDSAGEPSTGRSVGSDTAPKPSASIIDTVGKHCILELYECDRTRLDDEPFVRSAITNAALRAGATLLNLISHRFTPHGVTGLALLAESHISIHTWPESGYAAVDVFTCGDHTMPESACRVLVEEFGARRHQLRSFRRETPGSVAELERWPAAADSLPTSSASLG